MDTFIVSQYIAGVSFLIGICSFQFKTRRQILLCWFFADAINALHFFVLGRPAAVALLCVSASRFLTAAHTKDRRWMYLFFVLTIAGFSATYQHPVSFLVLISGILGTYGTFHQADKSVRMALLFCSVLWVIHNVIVGSPVAVVMELSYLASNVIGLWRHHGRDRKSAVAARTGVILE
jgi:hypothetical protein